MSHHSPLLEEFSAQLAAAARLGQVLDLACGKGRNGLYLLHKEIEVVFADRDANTLQHVEEIVAGQEAAPLHTFWQVDLELQDTDPLAGAQFGAILVFRYLHRPLMPHINRATRPGGMVIYETFTIDQPRYGRPTNPDYLLQHGELQSYFADWTILHGFEGVVDNFDSDGKRAIAQLVARKPA